MADLDTAEMMYLGDSYQVEGIDHPMAGRVDVVVNVGAAVTGMPGAFVNARRGHRFTIDVLELAADALRDAGADTATAATPPIPPGRRGRAVDLRPQVVPATAGGCVSTSGPAATCTPV